MFKPTSRISSIAAFALSTVFTLGMLGAVQGLASKPGADALLAKQGQTQVAASAKPQPAKS